MKVLWITPNYPSKRYPLAGIFQQQQVEILAENDIQVEVVAPTPFVPGILKNLNKRYRLIGELPRAEKVGSASIYRPRYFTTPREYIWGFSHIAQVISNPLKEISKPLLIHAHFAYPVGAAAMALKKKWRIPIVLTLHGDDVTIHPHVSRLHKNRFAKTVRGVDSVIAVSEALADETEEISGIRPFVLSVGIDPLRFQSLPDRSEERKLLGLPENAFIILYVGNLLSQKGVFDLERAFNLFPEKRKQLIFVGDGPHKPTGNGIVHFGNRPNQEIPKFLAASDLLVLPSHHEGLGQVVLEAGAAGKPVIGSETGGIKNLLSKKRGWLFPPKDFSALNKRLYEVRQNHEEAIRRGDRLRKHVLEKHSISINSAKLIQIYNESVLRNKSEGIRQVGN